MKNARTLLFFALMGLCVKNSLSQNDSLSFTERFDQIAEHLDKSQIPSNILYNRVVPISNIQNLKSTDIASDTTDREEWLQKYHEIYLSSYQVGNLPKVLDLIDKTYYSNKNNNKLSVALIDFNIHYFDSTAFVLHQLEWINDQLYDVVGRNNSPYKEKRITDLCFLNNKIYQGSYALQLNPDLLFNNIQRKVERIVFKINDQELELREDELKMLKFNTLGLQTIQFKIYFEDQSSYTGFTKVNVLSALDVPCWSTEEYSYPFDWIDPNGKEYPSKIEVAYYLSNCSNSHVRKPIVILDGFDPKDMGRNVQEVYGMINKAPLFIGEKLRALGYDLIVINFPNDVPNNIDYGANFIERNAHSVEQFLQYNLKTKMQNPEAPVILIGPSMGGLIARYTLQNMEKKQIAHNVKLYVSLDAPHQGANIPKGIQAFLHYYGVTHGNVNALLGWEAIASIAAKQMLIEHISTQNIYIDPNYLRICLLRNYDLSKMPKLSRNIAIINGSDQNVEQYLPDKLLNFSMDVNLFGNLLFRLTEADIYRSPKRESKSVFKAQYLGDPYRVDAIGTLRLNNMPINGSLDNCAGGKFYSLRLIGQYWNGSAFVDNKNTSVYASHHSFIPSVSALDIKYNNGSLFDVGFDISKEKSLVCNKLTLFDAYYAPHVNQDHVEITEENAEWLLYEIENATRTSQPGNLNVSSLSANEHFNFGNNTKTYYSGSLHILKDATLSINKNDQTGYLNEAVAISNSTFEVRPYNICGNPILLSVHSSGTLQLGDLNGNNGILRITKENILELQDGSQLKVFANSKIIIERGARLIVHPNAQIELIGAHSELIVEGELELRANAQLSFIGDGQINILSDKIEYGLNSGITLQGKSIDDVVLAIGASKYLRVPYGNNFQVQNGKIDMLGNTSTIDAFGRITLENVQVVGGKSIYVRGQKEVYISSSVFRNMDIAIVGLLNTVEQYGVYGNPLNLYDCSFQDCNAAVKIIGKGFNLKNIISNNCKRAIIAEGIELSSYVNDCQFNEGSTESIQTGIKYVGSTNAQITIENTGIRNFQVGIYQSQSSMNMHCVKIENARRFGIWTANNSALDLSPSYQSYSGNNFISVNPFLNNAAVFLENANFIHTKNGYNTYKIGSPIDNYYILGSLNPLVKSLDVRSNNWYTRLNNSSYVNPPDITNFSIHKSISSGSLSVQNYLRQPIMGSQIPADCSSNSRPIDPCPSPNACAKMSDEDPLSYSPNAPFVLLSNQMYAPYNDQLKWILTELKNDSTDQYIEQNFNYLNELCQINLVDSIDLLYLGDLSYQTMFSVFNKMIKYEQTETMMKPIFDFSMAYQKMSDVQDKRLLYYTNISDSHRSFYTTMDIGQLRNQMGMRSDAIQKFNQAQFISSSATEQRIANYWECITRTQQEIADGIYPVELQDSILNTCILDIDLPSGSQKSANTVSSDVDQAKIRAFPNPLNDLVTVEYESAIEEPVQIRVLDLSGREVYALNSYECIKGKNRFLLNLSELQKGMYIISIHSASTKEQISILKQ